MANDIPMHVVVQEVKREMAEAVNTICQHHNVPSWLGLMIMEDIIKENHLMAYSNAIEAAAHSADISEEADPDVGEG